MRSFTDTHPWAVGLIAVAVIGILLVVSSAALAIGGLKIEEYTPAVKFNEGIYTELPIQTTSVVSASSTSFTSLTGATTSLGYTSTAEFTQGGGVATLTDATGGTYTLTEAELRYSNVLSFAAGAGGQAVIALTFPATSTLSNIIPNAGDMREWLYDASALAAATTTTVTAGTGIDLIGVTTNDDVIDGAEWARITCWRQVDSDITCLSSELLHAD